MENKLRGAHETKKTTEIRTKIIFVLLLLLMFLKSFLAGSPSVIVIALLVDSLNLAYTLE